MATSGLYTLGLTFNEISIEAFDLLQIGEDGETLDGDMKSRSMKSANTMLKEWQTQGIHLWSYTEGTLFLTVGQAKYDFRESTTHIANTWHETTTTAATTADSYTFNVTNGSNFQVDDVVGIIQNDNNIFWTTIKIISTLAITVADAITLATLSGAYVRNYRPSTSISPALIPISRIKTKGIRRKETTDYEIPIVDASRQEYFDLPNKEQTGTPIQAYYSRQDIAGESAGIMYLWNSPSSSKPVINFTYERKLQIFSSVDDTADIPEFAQEAFIYNLAVKLITKYGCSPARSQYLKEEAFRLKSDMLSFDAEMKPIKVKLRA